MEDVLLVKRAIKGDRQSFEKLMDIYFDRLCREAYIRCKYEEDVKEIVQETIYKAYRNIRSLKEPQYFKTWLSRILINVANDYLRNKGMVDLELDETSYVKEVVIEDKIEIKMRGMLLCLSIFPIIQADFGQRKREMRLFSMERLRIWPFRRFRKAQSNHWLSQWS